MKICSPIIRSPRDTEEDKPWGKDKDFTPSADVTADSLLMDVFNT
jgi:hypothetical protein